MLFAGMLWSCELLVKTITILDTCVTNRILKRFTFEVRQLCTSLFPIVLEDKQSSQIHSDRHVYELMSRMPASVPCFRKKRQTGTKYKTGLKKRQKRIRTHKLELY